MDFIEHDAGSYDLDIVERAANPEDNTQPQSSTASSSSPTEPSPPQNPSSSSSSSGAGANNTPSSTQGDAYYNPEVQITGYGTAPGSFWVEHVNQSIEIGWQNIPANVNTILVARSASSTGPWGTITQQNPGENGSYSLQLVDNSLNEPYYYLMTAFNGSTTVATYGPVYLIPN